MFHTHVVESLTHHKLGNEDKARDLFQLAISNIPANLSELPETLKQDLVSTSENLGETELAEVLKSDIANGSNDINSEEVTNKYHYLLLNGKGIRLYNSNHIYESIEYFEKAAENLPENISVNMNAAQALLFHIKAKGKNPELLQRARNYLDISQKLDKNNEKYQKLEDIFSEVS